MKRLKALRELRGQLGAEVFLVGGTVRDLVRQREPNDLDLVVRGVSPADFEAFLRERGDLRLVGKSFGVYLFRPKRSKKPIEIAFPRTEVSVGEGHRDFTIHSDPNLSIKEDSRRRDYTLNSMYLSIEDIDERGRFERRDIIDPHGGLEHIKRRLVVAVGDPGDRIREDPLRMVRAVVLIARTGYRLEGDTFGAIKRNVRLMRSVAPERVRDEFVKILESEKPSRGIKAMARTGLLAEVFPELAACVGVGQNPKYHSYPVFEHLIYATDAACSLTDRLEIRMAALCHDLGKVTTRALREGGSGPRDVTFHNHETVSAKLAYAFLRRLRFPKGFTDEVVHLVRHHQYKYDRAWTGKAVRRFIRNVGIVREDLGDLDLHPQFILRQADRMGNKMKEHLPITPKQRDFQGRLVSIYRDSTAHNLGDLAVNGNDLQARLELKPGPIIGRLMDHLFDTVEGDPKANNKADLLEVAQKFLEEDSEKPEDRESTLVGL